MATVEARRAYDFHLPISSLPPELLSRIFCVLRDTFFDHPSHWKDLSEIRPDRWMAILRVCNTWRDVAIHTPMLWTHIVLSFQPRDYMRVQEMLHRSKQCPLVLMANLFMPAQYNSDESIMPSIYYDIKANLGRCRILNLCGVDTPFLDSLFVGSDYNQLESFRISYGHRIRNVAVLDDMLSRAKSIRRLHVEHGVLNLKNPSLVSLTHLILVHSWLTEISTASVVTICLSSWRYSTLRELS